MADGGSDKTRNSVLRESVLGILAGCFIGFGFSTCMLAAGQLSPEYRKAEPGMFNLLFGAYGFPVGLSMCVINGASLFTSNIAYMAAACIQRKASAGQGLFVLLWSYFMNLAGALLLVQFMVAGHVFYHREEFTIELALKKTSYSFGATMTKGILCNWMVCMAVWQGNAAQDITGKLLGIWFPISAFVTMGFEHCVANMFVIPLAMKLGAPISVGTFIVKNLIPSTIGNLIGGAVFVASMYGLAYGDWETAVNSAAAAAWARATGRPRTGGSSSSLSSSDSLSERPDPYVAALPTTVTGKSVHV
ncbi:hypothetical protein OEZ85_004451 [Tetradesmus obliquus]|uniref:Formate/nitrite transporter n=1 Tax=Tetradesmus obliquus TaxID=3088 RepID=A0ABY8UL74_TETOB|nr:hypothetical protein OEZ85_004451 [Tetradesmus obliquus]